MQKVSKKFDEKIDTINKIKNPKKRKYESHHKEDYYHIFQLPAITNTLTSFGKKEEKTPQKYDNLLTHRANNKMQTELDSIISGALKNYKNQKINKIIFASPMANRLSLGKTYYRTSRFASIDSRVTRYESEERTPTQKRRPKQFLNLHTINAANQDKEIQQFDISSLTHKNKSLSMGEPNQKEASQFGMFYTTPEEMPKPIPIKPMRKTYMRPVNALKKKDTPARYSPWRNQEGDDQLIL